jgi:hypothetical protein
MTCPHISSFIPTLLALAVFAMLAVPATAEATWVASRGQSCDQMCLVLAFQGQKPAEAPYPPLFFC